MNTVRMTCIECPIGCSIEVDVENGKPIAVRGNSCPRGKMYAENEVICPKRVLTSSVRAENGKMVSVKTNQPIKKSEMFEIMKIINSFKAKTPVRIGDVLIENISDGANLVATSNVD